MHPTFLYEMVWNVLVCLFLLWAHKAWKLGHGRVFALYVMGYTLGRFFIEGMRSDEATHIFGVRVNIIVSLVIFVIAAIVFFLLDKRRQGSESPEEVDPKYWAENRDSRQRGDEHTVSEGQQRDSSTT
mgnify:FL=1